ncbi:MAG: hypothetical protein HWN65_22720 [Candidatus Helarchaeota archaeon]|nr:hypothetical protein [Candidatus Helarchaeota archaeon]
MSREKENSAIEAVRAFAIALTKATYSLDRARLIQIAEQSGIDPNGEEGYVSFEDFLQRLYKDDREKFHVYIKNVLRYITKKRYLTSEWTIIQKNKIISQSLDVFGQKLNDIFVEGDVGECPRRVVIDELLSKVKGGQLIRGLERFPQLLGIAGPIKHSDWFEISILDLLGIIGFITLYFGGKIHAKGVDIMAFHPTKPLIFAISVTTGNDVGKKVRTLLPQFNNLKSNLSDKVLEYETIPVIVTPVSAENIRDSDFQDVKSHKIVLLSFDDIENVYHTVMEVGNGDLVDIITDFIRDKIPDWMD